MDLDITRRRLFPNLALMKLSAYHKVKRDEVFLNFPLCQPDITYASCVFTWHEHKVNELPPNATVGGSGVDLAVELPPEVESIMPDYELYPNIDFSLGFTSRGCPRRCPFCVVPEKEGKIRAVASVYDFWDKRHKKIVILDNNLLAAPNWRETLKELIEIGVEVDFNQGLDIRLVNEDNVGYLKWLRVKQLRFAFDNMASERAVREGVELLVGQGLSSRRLSFYVLVGFNEDDTAIERMKILNSYNVSVYPMIYKDKDGKEPEIKTKWDGNVFWHGGRQNLRKFLRVVGRLR